MSDCSIVIPVHNRASLTRECLDALLDQDLDGAEIVVVDDCSGDDTPEMLASYGDRLRTLRMDPNGGFAAACNAGVAACQSELVVLLNNDTQPVPGWLGALTAYADEHPEAGVVGCKLLWPTGAVQHAGVVIDAHKDVRHVYLGFPADHPAVNYPRRFQVVTAACVLIRRELFEQLGGLDTAYRNGYEDVDFCLRAGELGHKIRSCPTSVLYHLESASRSVRGPGRPAQPSAVQEPLGRACAPGRRGGLRSGRPAGSRVRVAVGQCQGRPAAGRRGQRQRRKFRRAGAYLALATVLRADPRELAPGPGLRRAGAVGRALAGTVGARLARTPTSGGPALTPTDRGGRSGDRKLHRAGRALRRLALGRPVRLGRRHARRQRARHARLPRGPGLRLPQGLGTAHESDSVERAATLRTWRSTAR